MPESNSTRTQVQIQFILVFLFMIFVQCEAVSQALSDRLQFKLYQRRRPHIFSLRVHQPYQQPFAQDEPIDG